MGNQEGNSIVELISRKNPKGYEMLCQKYSGVLHGIIIAIVKDTQAAEIILKHTCQHICGHIQDYHREQISFLTWALQQARSVSKAHLMDSQVQGVLIPQPVHVIAGVELLLITDSAGANKDERILDMVLQGSRLDEVAQKLNITVEAVRMSVRNGLKLKAKKNQ